MYSFISCGTLLLCHLVHFSIDITIAICCVAFFLLFISGAIWGEVIFYVLGVFFFIGLFEFFLIKCPYCKKMPIKMAYTFPLFPQKCGKCGKSLL